MVSREKFVEILLHPDDGISVTNFSICVRYFFAVIQ